jgi:hypothetical protein
MAGLAKLQHWLTPQLDGTVNLIVCLYFQHGQRLGYCPLCPGHCYAAEGEYHLL